MKARLSTFVATVGAVSALAATALTPAASAADAIANAGWCRPNAIEVSAPNINPIDTGPGYHTGGSQWTAFQSVLERYDFGLGRWVDVYWSEPYFFEAHYGPTLDGDKFWYQDRYGTWRYTTAGQSLPMAGRHGYFRYSLVVSWLEYTTGQLRLVGQGMWGERAVTWDYCYYA